ncbi:UrvD/REP family ATP-dependent DNA helicase [Arcanobacterium buesumense]|uniref:DNA 3'-5' helicase n=1 Tax=Arcanobacterium buesumense TaxID=2722751 RepID=A0A6H2EM61_9ACTO|nr:UrvD/REP family ATP-dependent DNA helicase [Arcanobacterium buesumense]QJC22168.1 ATP-dependent helicase [Arcanobacterium buesumense]
MSHAVPDSSQEAVIEACYEVISTGQRGCAFSILGAPGTGKTELIKRCVSEVLVAEPQSRIAVLSPDRRAASDMRNVIVEQLSVLGENIKVRSITAFAFAIVSEYAQAIGRKEPELLSGPDQDAVIRDVIDIATRFYPTAGLLGSVDPQVAQLEAFRREYRDLLTRSAELGLTAQELRELGKENHNPSWVIGGDLLEEYEKALAVQAGTGRTNPDRTDHSRIVTQAAALLQQWDNRPGEIIARKRPEWDWVFVDDISNCTLALRTLLAVMQSYGTRIVTCGDPDVGVQGYRGGIAKLPVLLERPRNLGGLGAQRFVLNHRYRGGGDMAGIIAQVSSAIHVAGSAAHRLADYQHAASCQIAGHVLLSEHDEVAYLATRMQYLHAHEGVDYSQMAVVTRSRSQHRTIRQALLDYGIPVQALPAVNPLRFQPVVAHILLLINIARGYGEDNLVSEIRQVLTGPLFELSASDLSVLLGRLHGWELVAGGNRVGEQLLATVIDEDPHSPAAQIPQFHQIRRVLANIRRSLRKGSSAEEVLWVTWDGVDKAEQWRDISLAGGKNADQANRNLDAVIQLFRIAQRLTDRDPQGAHIDDLLRVLEEQDVPEDSIARVSANDEGIILTSPSATIGRTWSHVFISQLNEGVWPNLRLRNPLTHVPELVSLVVGSQLAGRPIAAKQRMSEVLDDELRMLLYALTRATCAVEITCIQSEDIIPSRFLSWLFPDGEGALTFHSTASLTLDTPSFIGQLRQAQRRDNSKLRQVARDFLEQLNELDIEGFSQKIWVDNITYTQQEPSTEALRISPSKVENILDCPMRGILDSAHGQALGDVALANLGTLIHQIAEETVDPDLDAMKERLAQLWPTFDFGSDLVAEQLRERAESMIGKLYEYLSANPGKALRELYATIDLGDIVVSGKIDRLEYVAGADGAVRIVDFKTGKTKPSQKQGDNNAQLLIYQWLVAQGGVQMPAGMQTPTTSFGAQLVHIGTPTKTYSVTSQDALETQRYQEIEKMILNAAQAQRSQEIPAIARQQSCRSCAYKTLCPAQEGKRIFS